jgi:hypothetical protein
VISLDTRYQCDSRKEAAAYSFLRRICIGNMDPNLPPTEINTRQHIDVKPFTFRSLPASLHRAWKTCAAAAGITMEDFALRAIQKAIDDFTVTPPT